ncbi:hypothetical protein [Ideonella sp.]|uniref:hypothetical protein n=1 Tax=Ideonella sp. TaxID=1929293 RepID=UPI0035AFA217
MIRWIKAWAAGLAASAMLAGCSGGGGEPGSCSFSCPGGPGSETTYEIAVDVQRSGASVTSIGSTETVQAVAHVVDSTGHAAEGVLVTFTESNAALLKFAPSTGTALTDSDGYASLDISAQTTASAGATTVNAAASVGGKDYSAAKSISVTAGGQVDVAEPSALNFISVVPADQAIVIKGAGGNGRSESASLTFKVVDASNTPIKGVNVSFAVNPSGKVTLNIPNAVSDLNGLVVTTVHSGTEPTSVVVTATALTSDNEAVTGQSDTLVVSNGVVIAEGFEIVAEKYNLDGRITGDDTKISAFVRDAFGNPVPDGLAVSFVTDFGSVASSNMGGCLTVNGTCSVDFRVQDPRGEGLATVIASVSVGEDVSLSDAIPINMAGAKGSFAAAATSTGPILSQLTMTSCSQAFFPYLLDSASGRSATAGTTIAVDSTSANLGASVAGGSPVRDSLSFEPTLFTLNVNATSTALRPLCNPNGTPKPGGTILMRYQTPGGVSDAQILDIYYPQ